jgi:tetratricopeptide (TPR) repeat protein
VRIAGSVLLLLLLAVGGVRAQDDADRAWSAGDLARARTLYEARLAADTADARALHRVALMDAWDGRYDRSLRLFTRLLALGPNLEAEVDRARVTAWRGAPNEAVVLLDSLLVREPGYIPALEARAEFLAWAGEPNAAVESYARLAEILPDNRSVRSARARLLSWASRLDESIALYDSLVRTDPADRDARLGLARSLGWAGRTDSAAAVYHGMLHADSSDVDAWAGLAQTRSWAGRLREAETLWDRALAVDSNHVPALVGLAQTLRWQGRDAAADEALRRAEARDPTNQEARTQRRWLDGAIRPRAGSTVTYESDSDGNGIVTVLARGGYRLRPRVDLRPYGYFRWLGLDGGPGIVWITLRAWGGGLEIRTEIDPGWVVGASLGASASTPDTIGTQVRWGANVSSPGWWPVVTSLSATHEPLDATHQLVRNGVTVTQGALDLRATPAPGWTATGTFSVAEFRGSASNVRTAGALGVSRRVLRFFAVGATGRAYGFSDDLADGYFDPDFYLLLEAPVRWEQEFGRWVPSAEVAPGVQKISGVDLSAAIRLAGGVRYAVMPGREIALSAGYSTLGLSLFAEGGGGYEYRYVALSGGWWF